MKFGKVNDAGKIDLNLHSDNPDTPPLLEKLGNDEKTKIFVGCAKWNRKELPNFYPKGTKDELFTTAHSLTRLS